MNISEETKQNLEFDRILEYVCTKCVSELGKKRLLNIDFLTDKDRIEKLHFELNETKIIYQVEGGLPLWQFQDMRTLLHKIEPLESYLEPGDCLLFQSFLEICAEIVNFFNKHGEKYPHLKTIFYKIDPLHNITKLIRNTIDPAGNLFDNASPELKKIRSELDFISKQIHIKLERIARKQAEHLQDDYITLREERLVLPVREYSVNKIPGIVHGQSATGQTHYVEPMSVVPLNNEIQQLYAHEKKEIIKILKRLSQNIRETDSEILLNLDLLTHLDVLQAKAQFSIKINGNSPMINDSYEWEIIDGYHPLLLKRLGTAAIPLSLNLGNDPRMIIITGPNAGGKTVALKTVGLLQVLFQSGFHVPVKEGSKLPICNNIFTVIGDEQSIENDLSTFSSHIKKLNDIVENAGHRSLILIDEIGAGTDSSEGSALAMAIMEQLNREGLVTIVTTHHSELKSFAQNEKNVMNAAMQFDTKTLAPLFNLEMGIPGSSYAFDISRRLGVLDKILNRAKEIMGSAKHNLENMIIELSEKKQEFEQKRKELSIKETELDGLKSLYQTRADDLKIKRKKFEEEAREEAKNILKTVNKTIESVIRDIKESNAKQEVIIKGRKEITNLRKQVESVKTPKIPNIVSIEEIKNGDTVRSKRFELSGQVSKVFKEKNEIEIESKGMKIVIPLEDIEISSHISSKNTSTVGYTKETITVRNELDLRGKLAEEALIELEKYLDQALRSEWSELRIIHGKGTGALREAVHKSLKRNKLIKSFRLGNIGEGDAGVTVIEL